MLCWQLMYSLYLPIPNCTYVFLVWWTKTSLEDVACHIFRTPVYCLKIMPDMLWQFCFLSLKKRTFKLEPFFFHFSSKTSSILSILQIWETYKLNFYDNMQTSNKIWSVFIILQEKSFYQKILQKIWPGH